MSESLRNDGRVWVPKKNSETRKAEDIPEDERDYFLERIYPSFGNLAPRDVSSRQAKFRCDEGLGVGPTKQAVYLDFRDAINRDGVDVIAGKYGNLFEMYERITGDNPYKTPMMIYPAVHYTMGGLWVDYNLQSTIPGLHVLGEANFSDHGANRLGASALMQGLADGYFVAPYTISNYLASTPLEKVNIEDKAFKDAEEAVKLQTEKLLNIKGHKTASEFHRELGKYMWNEVGMSRSEAGLKKAIDGIRKLREEFWQNLKINGDAGNYNTELHKAARVADFIELGELMALDALERRESCGGHFREEYQTADNEAKRDDENFTHAAVWEYTGPNSSPVRHKEELIFENVKLATRSYK
jgi:succinate dehydrogenase / fumarate reductase flavoprotein subunit